MKTWRQHHYPHIHVFENGQPSSPSAPPVSPCLRWPATAKGEHLPLPRRVVNELNTRGRWSRHTAYGIPRERSGSGFAAACAKVMSPSHGTAPHAMREDVHAQAIALLTSGALQASARPHPSRRPSSRRSIAVLRREQRSPDPYELRSAKVSIAKPLRVRPTQILDPKLRIPNPASVNP